MSTIKSQGLQLAIASTLGTQFTVSAISNANPAVATLSASHGVLAGDVIVLASGWKRLDGRVVRVLSVSTNDVTLEDIDTSSTADYPAGEGVGTGREVTGWTNISQLLPEVSVSGGGFRFADVTEIDDVRSKQIPVLAESTQLTFKYHWDNGLAWRATVEAASRGGTPVPYRMSLGATRIYGNAYWGYASEPTIENSVLVSSLTLSGVADVTTY